MTATRLIKITLLVLLSIAITEPASGNNQHQQFLPMVSVPAPKAGVAFASHKDGQERVELLGDSVAYWRGWQRGGVAQDKWGLEATQSLWCDFYFHRHHSDGKLIYQMPTVEKLPKNFSGWLLLLNEPDLSYYGKPPQCAADPIRAAQIYSHVRQILPHAKIVAPAATEFDYKNDYEWLGLWWDEVVRITGQPPQVAAWDFHNYLQGGNPLAPYDALESWLNERGVTEPKFFISEWGACSVERMSEMKAAFDADERIVRHYIYEQYGATWDGGACIVMFEGDSRTDKIRLTELGRAFLGLVPVGEIRRDIAD